MIEGLSLNINSSSFTNSQNSSYADELKECEGCTGFPTCRKSKNQYFVPKGAEGYGYCKVGQARQLRPLFKRACLPAKYTGKTFDDYLDFGDNRDAIKIAQWFTKKKPDKSLYIYGACGTGKTFLASIIAQEYLQEFKQVIFGDVPTLLDEIKRTFDGRGDAGEIVDRYCECDLLILDDLGAGQVTEWNIGQLYQIINYRYTADKPLVVTSNFDLDGLEKRLTVRDNFSAKRITSRLSEICIQAFLGTKDRRK